MFAASLQCGVSAMCFREQSVSAVQTHCSSQAKEHKCNFYTGVRALVFPLCGLKWASLKISWQSWSDEALLASKYKLYVAAL